MLIVNCLCNEVIASKNIRCEKNSQRRKINEKDLKLSH